MQIPVRSAAPPSIRLTTTHDLEISVIIDGGAEVFDIATAPFVARGSARSADFSITWNVDRKKMIILNSLNVLLG